MSSTKIAILGFLMLLLSGISLAQDPEQQQQQQQQQQEQEQEETAAPPPAPRVVGQARTQEEFDAYQAIENAVDKVGASDRFLATYPDSGLTPFVHQLMAQHYDDTGDFVKFLDHAAKALAEIPGNAPILTRVAFVSAEKGLTSNTIIERAEKALEILETLEKPEAAAPEEWVQQMMQLRADANYAIGRTYLNKFTGGDVADDARAEHPDLQNAVTYFKSAIDYDPRHDYAYFRLGFAETSANHAEAATLAYAAAVATGGVAAGPAQDRLRQIHDFIRENMEDSALASKSFEEVVEDANIALAQQVQEKQQEQAEMVEAIRQQEAATQPTVPPAAIPPPPPSL